MKNIFIQKVFLIRLGLFVLCIFSIFYLIYMALDYSSSSRKEERLSLPARLIIPTIKIDSLIEYVGVTTSGEMDTPKNINNVAWFKLGVIPSNDGSAVIDGHYGWENGKGSVFNNLYKLNKGDKIYVKNNKGEDISFVVDEIKKYPMNNDTKDIFISDDGKAHLNLITCSGTWNRIEKKYSDRLVIFTTKEKQK